MKSMRALLLVPGLILFMAAANAEPRIIPDAPAEALARTNPITAESFNKMTYRRVARLYKNKCKKCHGVKGDGQGPRADEMIIKPARFSDPGYLSGRKDGQLFWIIANGSPGTDMPAHGPGTRINLTEDEIWRLVYYLRKSFTN